MACITDKPQNEGRTADIICLLTVFQNLRIFISHTGFKVRFINKPWGSSQRLLRAGGCRLIPTLNPLRRINNTTCTGHRPLIRDLLSFKNENARRLDNELVSHFGNPSRQRATQSTHIIYLKWRLTAKYYQSGRAKNHILASSYQGRKRAIPSRVEDNAFITTGFTSVDHLQNKK